MDILFVALNAKYCHTNPAVRSLSRLAGKEGYSSGYCEFTINDSFTKLLGEIYSVESSIYAFSCYIWNTELVIRLARELVCLRPESKILFGGPEVSYSTEKFLANGFVDAVFSGEAEEQIAGVTAYLLGRQTDLPPGLAIKNATFAAYQTVSDMSLVTSAYTKEDLSNARLVYVETSRGCPFHCAYCLSAATSGVRFREEEEVFAELDQLVRYGVKLIKFTDRTFNLSSERTLRYFKRLRDRYSETVFHFEIFAGLLTDEILAYLETVPPGRFQFEIGIQTTNTKALEGINRNEKMEDSLKRIALLKSYGNIHLHVDLIAGLPYDTMEGVKQSVNDVFDLSDNLQLGFLKLLSGAPIEETCKNQHYIFCHYPPYEIEACDGFSFEDILYLKRVEETIDIFCNSGYFTSAIEYLLAMLKSPYDFLAALTHFCSKFEKLSHQRQYECLYLFGETVEGISKTRLRDTIRSEYFKKYRNRPAGSLNKTYSTEFIVAARSFLSDSAKVKETLRYLKAEDVRKIHKNVDIHSFDFGGPAGETILLFDYKYDKITDITNYFY